MKKKTFGKILVVLLALAAPLGLQAQQKGSNFIPDEDYYLMPSFGEGHVVFHGKPVAQGKMNICALDNSLRFIDENGTELEALDPDSIARVLIDDVWFLRSGGVFYRLYPATYNLGIAVRRDVRILQDAKRGAYGEVSQTAAITEYGSLHTEHGIILLDGAKKVPYDVTETLYLFKGDNVYLFTKRNVKKLFKDKKKAVDAYFESNLFLPDNAPDALEMIKGFMK